MPYRRGATLFEDLPEEIIDNILLRLPSKAVGCCRVLSTSLRNATSTAGFMLQHHSRQPSLPIINGNWRPTGLPDLVVLRDTGASQQLGTFVWNDEDTEKEYFLHSACDGFLIVSRGSRFYICNPVINKHALLPRPQVGKFIYSFVIRSYRHRPTGEYRVLWVSHRVPWLQVQSEPSLYVHTVGSNVPRQVRVRMPADFSPSEEKKLLNSTCFWFAYLSPVHHCGSLYWCPYGGSDILGGGRDIVVFDTEAESFRCIRSPAQSCPNTKLFHMEGALALWGSSSTQSFTTMDVWVMQDYEAEIWAFKYRIDLSMVEASRQLYLTSFKRKRKPPLDSTVEEFNDMAVLNERELLIKFNRNHVLRCDIDGNYLGMVNIGKSHSIGKSHYSMVLTQHRLQESIIPIPSHEMQGEDDKPTSSSTRHLTTGFKNPGSLGPYHFYESGW